MKIYWLLRFKKKKKKKKKNHTWNKEIPGDVIIYILKRPFVYAKYTFGNACVFDERVTY